MKNGLYWLPGSADFNLKLDALKKESSSSQKQFDLLRQLADTNLDFVQALKLDRFLQNLQFPEAVVPSSRRAKVAILSSATIDHLLPSFRIGALRRGLLVELYLPAFNQYRQEIINPQSGLYAFVPDVTVLMPESPEAFVKTTLSASWPDVEALIKNRVEDLAHLWELLSQKTGSAIIQWNAVVPPWGLFGHREGLVPASAQSVSSLYNELLRRKAQEKHAHLFDTEALASYVGKAEWCDLPLWHHAKQPMPPQLAPLVGEHMARQVAALRGLSRKCLALDLDNTLWGGVIGDDGLEGIVIGQGSAEGESFLSFQTYAKALRERGIILAVCSKNEESNAVLPFDQHPEMVLRRNDITVFMANWVDKAANLTELAKRLNIGLDSIVFFDDNPAERELVRKTLPMVAVPEVPEDPALYVPTLADAGYFEAAAFTADDMARAEQYQANAKRQELSASNTDMDSFLKSLNMEMTVGPFDDIGLSRIVQLINKSNQFNLTTRRYTDIQIKQVMENSAFITFQARLKDTYGDNGMISVLIAKPRPKAAEKSLEIDTWLMSCRVLGRKVEEELLNCLAAKAQEAGYSKIYGEFIPTEKTDSSEIITASWVLSLRMLRLTRMSRAGGCWILARYKPRATPMKIHWQERSHT